jgi:hypothetical protein
MKSADLFKSDYFNIGSAYLKQGKHDKAFDKLFHCLKIRQSLMPTHYYTGLTNHKIGVVMRERGDLDLAV